MFPETNNIIQAIMTNLKDVRKVTEVHTIRNNAVRIRVNGKMFDIRGTYPLFSVHEIDGACMMGSKDAYEVERQLNGNPIVEEDEPVPESDEKYHQALCAFVDSMPEEAVKRYNEECGGPDLDTIDVQRTWLKTHFIFIGHDVTDLLDKVKFMEGKERMMELAKTIL